jgi:light-harvesting complex 1 beta chain
MDMAESAANNTGLTEDEAKEFHTFFTQGISYWFGLVVVAHVLVWMWCPWLTDALCNATV